MLNRKLDTANTDEFFFCYKFKVAEILLDINNRDVIKL